jgi:predicted PurR-regulated permease PerM
VQTSPKPVRDWNVSPAADSAAPPRPIEAEPRASAQRSLARAVWILAACATVAALRIGRDLLIPLVLGVLLALVLSGIVETLRRWRVPRALSALVLLLLIAVGIGGVLDAIWTPAQQWIENAPRVLRTVERRLRPAQSIVQRLDAIADRVSNIASPGGKEAAPPSAAPAPSVTAASVLAGTGWLAASIVMWLALTLLLLAAGPGTLARMTATLAADWHAANVLRIIHAIRNEVGRYYATLAVINVGFGAVTALVMWLLGMPNPALWGAIAAVLNFIPYLGCITTLVILSVVALVTFDHITHTLLVGASFLILAAIEGHVVEPVFIGRRLDLNPIVVLVAIWMGGWIWGITGVVVALPTLVAAKVAASHSLRGGALVRFLSPNRRPERPWEERISRRDAAWRRPPR